MQLSRAKEADQNHSSGSNSRVTSVKTYRQLPGYRNLSFMARYIISYYKGQQNYKLFNQVKTYCLFIGHARSGHSIYCWSLA